MNPIHWIIFFFVTYAATGILFIWALYRAHGPIYRAGIKKGRLLGQREEAEFWVKDKAGRANFFRTLVRRHQGMGDAYDVKRLLDLN